MIAVAGANPDARYPLDGQDLRSVLASPHTRTDRTFFWRTRSQGAVRAGNWKYIREGKIESLYDLSVDEREQANFADAQPGKLAALRQQFLDWESQMVPYPQA